MRALQELKFNAMDGGVGLDVSARDGMQCVLAAVCDEQR